MKRVTKQETRRMNRLGTRILIFALCVWLGIFIAWQISKI